MCFGIYRGVELYTMPPENTISVERKMRVNEKRKDTPPKEAPKSFDQKKLARMEMLESSDLVLEDHIVSVLEQNKYSCMGKNREEYAIEISSSILAYTKGNIQLALWVAAMAQVESSYRLNADPKISNARGFLQVIPKWHRKTLAKAGITARELSTNPAKSIMAGVLVFKQYLDREHGNYKNATRRYRGLNESEESQSKYYNSILKIYNKLLDELRMYA